MFIKLLLIAISFIGLAFFIMSIKVIFHKKKRFPVTSIGKNPELRKIGLSCPKHDEIKCFKTGADKESCCG